MPNSNNSSIVKHVSLMTVLAVFAVVISFFKESVTAYYFGTSVESDALTLSLDMPRVIFTFLSASISAVVVPIYSSELIQNGQQRAKYFFSNFTTVVALICVLISLITELLADSIIRFFAPGFSPEALALTLRMFRWTIPAIALAVVGNISTAVLNCHKSFCLPAMAPIFYNLLFICCLFAAADTMGIRAALIGTVVGMVLEFSYRVLLRRRYVHYTPVLDLRDPPTRKAVKMSVPVILGMAVTEVNLLVDKMVASFFSAGSITALNYASKISSGISTLMISGLSEVIFPELSQRVAEGGRRESAKLYLSVIRFFVLMLFPIIAGGAFLRRDIVAVLYARGQFDMTSVAVTSPLFAIYLFSILFAAIRDVSTKFLYSYGDSKTAMVNSIIGVAVNIILNLALSKLFGISGLALATTISAALVCLLLIRSIQKQEPEVRFQGFTLFVGKILFACLCMLLVLIGISTIWKVDTNAASMAVLCHMIVSVVLGAAVYFAALLLLRVDEVRLVLRKLNSLLHKKEA